MYLFIRSHFIFNVFFACHRVHLYKFLSSLTSTTFIIDNHFVKETWQKHTKCHERYCSSWLMCKVWWQKGDKQWPKPYKQTKCIKNGYQKSYMLWVHYRTTTHCDTTDASWNIIVKFVNNCLFFFYNNQSNIVHNYMIITLEWSISTCTSWNSGA